MLAEFGQTKDADTASKVVSLAVVTSDAVKDTKRLVELAEMAVKTTPESPAAVGVLGAALYRAGDFKSAEKRLRQALEKPGQAGTVPMKLFLAMTHWQLKDPGEAKQWLAQAVKQMDDAGTQRPPSWHDRITWQTLRREAEMPMNGPRGSSDDGQCISRTRARLS